MRNSQLLGLLDGGRRPLLGVTFEPGLDAAVARAHMSVNQPECDGQLFLSTLLLRGVERPPHPANLPDGDVRNLDDRLCHEIEPEELVPAMGEFAGPGYLALAMDAHTEVTLRRLRIATLSFEDALASITRTERRSFEKARARQRRVHDTYDRHSLLTWVTDLSRHYGLRLVTINRFSAAERLAVHACNSARNRRSS